MKAEDLKWRVIDKPGETFKVHRSIYTDPEIFELEIQHIYEGNWVYIDHESKLPNSGDYLTTTIGRQPVLITRDEHGELRGFINACSHRGATVCRKARGNAKRFTCQYHGWVYDNHGTLLDIKQRERGGYPADYASRNYNLTPLPHLASHHGFIFASLNPDSAPLLEHLGNTARFIEMFANQSPEGLEVLRGHSVYTHRGNWKMQAENGVDGYHVDIVHASYFRLQAERAKQAAAASSGPNEVKAIQVDLENTNNGNYDLGNGHVMIWTDVPNFRDRALGMQYDALVERVGELEARWMAARLRQVLIYPNLILFDGISTQLRSWRPISTDETEVYAVCVAPKGEPAAARDRRIRQYEDFYGASGIATPDDLTEFDACQSGYHGKLAEWHDFDRGMARRHIGPDRFADEVGITPAVSANDFADETLYHGEYRYWLQTLCDGIEKSGNRRRAA
ncbi:MAG: aromatic ring-hydroxylating dioxygenase subunit alpha [Pseudomonadota bacterium]|nr:aromatic ring-hydroxylating dioxygenase subunit alpha [Pseudomonadota bacterium]